MKRRELITLLGGAVAWPLAARAQRPAVPVVGFLSSASPGPFASRLQALRKGLSEAGYVEGHNLAIEYRWAEGHYDRLPQLAADLVHLNVAAIFASNGVDALAAKEKTSAIPIVFNTAANPVEVGLVTSLSRPGGNVTGVSLLNAEVAPKRLELLHQLVPQATNVALLINPTNSTLENLSKSVQEAARTLGLTIQVVHASTERDFDAVFATLDQLRASALLIVTDPFLTSHSEQLAALALSHKVPASYQAREFTLAGGLMSYGGSVTDAFRLAGVYTGRVLKGEKPADLPVQQSTKVEFVINLRTAKAIGLQISPMLLALADEVIE